MSLSALRVLCQRSRNIMKMPHTSFLVLLALVAITHGAPISEDAGDASLMLNNTAPAGCGAGSKGEQTCAAQNKTCCCDPVHSPSCCCNPGLGCGSPYSGNFCGNPPSCPASGTSKCGPVNPCCCTKWEGVAPNATCTQHVCCDVPEFGCSAYGGCCVPPRSSHCYQPQQPEWYVTG